MNKVSEFINKALEFLRDRNDGYSYKRITGVSAFVVAVVVAFTTRDTVMAGVFLAHCASAAVACTMEKQDV